MISGFFMKFNNTQSNPMNSFIKSSFLQIAIVLTAVLFIQSCSDDNNRPTGPDFSTVPEPYDLSQADTTYTKEGGVEIYVIEEGHGAFEVIPRDQIGLKFTGRVLDDYIFDSSYENGNVNPVLITNLKSVTVGRQSPQVEGFRRGLLGMVEGEKRVIIVPPSLGYDDSNPGVNGFDLRGETLRYDVELTGIQ